MFFNIYNQAYESWIRGTYSSEEPRPTEAVAATWQYRGALWLAKRYTSTLISVFLTEFRHGTSHIKQLPNWPHEAGWTPFQTLYFKKNI